MTAYTHFYPVNDFREHNTETPECWCNPRIEDDMVIHNALDQRERFETKGLDG